MLHVKLNFYQTVSSITSGIYPFRLNRAQKDRIESPFKSKKKSGLILNSILTPIFYSIVEALNVVLLGAIQPERVYNCSPQSSFK
jgi:hypothetical protein